MDRKHTYDADRLGVRGIDRISRYYGTPSSFSLREVSYPVYDGHGNMVLTIRRDGSSFTTHDERRYDVWGSVRAGSGASSQRYCANLGHQQDDESGLIYMRARYYEPGSGRFISEDPAMDGQNWFAYCGNDPVGRVDERGQRWGYDEWAALGMLANVLALLTTNPVLSVQAATLSITFFCCALNDATSLTHLVGGREGGNIISVATALYGLIWSRFGLQIITVLGGAKIGINTAAGSAVVACSLYAFICLAALMEECYLEGNARE